MLSRLEAVRKSLHMGLVLAPPLGWFLVGRTAAVASLAFVIVLLAFGGFAERKGYSLPVIGSFLGAAKREREILPLEPIEFFLAMLLLGVVVPEPIFFASIAVLAIGDGIATLAGLLTGRHALPWNRKKSLEGTAAGVAAAIPAAILLDRIGRWMQERGYAENPLLGLEIWQLLVLQAVAVLVGALALGLYGRARRRPAVRIPVVPALVAILAALVAAATAFVLIETEGGQTLPFTMTLPTTLAIAIACLGCMLLESFLARHDNIALPLAYVAITMAFAALP